jgi:hypothetical protein
MTESKDGRGIKKVILLRDALSLSEEDYQRLKRAISHKASSPPSSRKKSTKITNHFHLPPRYHIPRPTALYILREKVLTAQKEGQWVALIGLVGQGKTTLLAELVRDPDIQASFGPRIAGCTSSEDSELSQNLVAALLGHLPVLKYLSPLPCQTYVQV